MKKQLCKKIMILLFSVLLIGGCTVNGENHSTHSAQESDDEISQTVSEEISETVSEDTSEAQPEVNKPRIYLDKCVFEKNETISVCFENTDEKDWIGFYPEGADPGTINSIVWNYSVGNGTLKFNASALGEAGVYWVFLCDNDGYGVLDMLEITVSDSDKTDYGVAYASVNAKMVNGFSETTVTITPSAETEVTYRLYWSSGEKRLEGYDPLHTVTHEGKETFTVKLNDGIFMPDEADGIEIAVAKGNSVSFFAPVSDELKLTDSKLLYKFNVLTDLHITPSRPNHSSHLTMAFEDIISFGESAAIFTCGDNTDRGTSEEYALLLDIIEKAGNRLPDIYFALGNHDIVYNNNAGYSNQIKLFENNLKTDAPYYSVELNGTRFITLGSDTLSATGTIGNAQLEWLKAELEKTDKGSPVFIFVHQPLKDTVSGSLYSIDNEIQDWFGIYETADELREILNDYPNAYLFTGHTHWSFESLQPVLLGRGEDANFVNCASVGYLWNDMDTSTGGSQGLYVEVYEDYILLRGREFLKGVWCAAAQFKIPIYGE